LWGAQRGGAVEERRRCAAKRRGKDRDCSGGGGKRSETKKGVCSDAKPKQKTRGSPDGEKKERDGSPNDPDEKKGGNHRRRKENCPRSIIKTSNNTNEERCFMIVLGLWTRRACQKGRDPREEGVAPSGRIRTNRQRPKWGEETAISLKKYQGRSLNTEKNHKKKVGRRKIAPAARREKESKKKVRSREDCLPRTSSAKKGKVLGRSGKTNFNQEKRERRRHRGNQKGKCHFPLGRVPHKKWPGSGRKKKKHNPVCRQRDLGRKRPTFGTRGNAPKPLVKDFQRPYLEQNQDDQQADAEEAELPRENQERELQGEDWRGEGKACLRFRGGRFAPRVQKKRADGKDHQA